MKPFAISNALACALALCVVFAGAGHVVASPAMPVMQDSDDADQSKLLEMFVHYVLIAKPELAEANGKALLDSGITDAELATLVDESNFQDRFDRAISRGWNMSDGVSDLARTIHTRVEQGRHDLARNPDRITESIKMLVGTLRQKMFGEQRLLAAGEYAMPQLLKQIVDGTDPQLEAEVTKVIEQIKRQAVIPLCVALPEVDAGTQRKICDMLGQIGWPTAAPFLLELAQNSETPENVKLAAMRAYRRVGGQSDNVASQFAALARRYFNQQQSLIPYPGDADNNFWRYDHFAGLQGTPVPTNIFCQVMAMTMARDALVHEPGDATALSLYVAADLRRENQMKSGQSDPIFGDKQYSPQFFATASGVATCQDVLSMAIEDLDTPLASDAIFALSKNAGASSILESGRRQPLIECLHYPDRRIQMDAALLLANAMPDRSFPGDFTVIPILASAVGSGENMYATVIASSDEDRRQLSTQLQGMGFTVLTGGSTYAEAEQEIVNSVGIDLIVVRGADSMVESTISSIHNSGLTRAMPVLVVAPSTDKVAMDRMYADDRRVSVFAAGGNDDQFASTVSNLMDRASGGMMTSDDALEYTIRSLETLMAVAISNSQVYSINDAQTALLGALKTRDGAIQVMVAQVLALMDSEKAQQALLDAALSATGNQQIDLMNQVATSARHFGNKTMPRQVDALRTLIQSSTGDTADAAANAYGALDLPSSETVKLIVK